MLDLGLDREWDNQELLGKLVFPNKHRPLMEVDLTTHNLWRNRTEGVAEPSGIAINLAI